MTNIISQLPVGVVKVILDYCVFLEKEEVKKLLCNLMSTEATPSNFHHGLIKTFNFTKITTYTIERSKHFEIHINVIGNLFGHSSILEHPAFEIYKGPFLKRELSLYEDSEEEYIHFDKDTSIDLETHKQMTEPG